MGVGWFGWRSANTKVCLQFFAFSWSLFRPAPYGIIPKQVSLDIISASKILWHDPFFYPRAVWISPVLSPPRSWLEKSQWFLFPLVELDELPKHVSSPVSQKIFTVPYMAWPSCYINFLLCGKLSLLSTAIRYLCGTDVIWSDSNIYRAPSASDIASFNTQFYSRP